MGSWMSKNENLRPENKKRSLHNIHRHHHHHHHDHLYQSTACNTLGGPFNGFPHERVVTLEIVLVILIFLGCLFVVSLRAAPNLIPGLKGQTVIAATKRKAAAYCAWSVSATMGLFYVFAASSKTLCLGQEITLSQEIGSVMLCLTLVVALFAAVGCRRAVKQLKQEEIKEIPLA